MRRVLIANSSEIYALSLARKLSGFDVRVCCDGAQVLSLMDSFQPEILILHTAMPRKDSLAILREMPCRPDLILATTNYLDGQLERRLLALGVRQILLMPSVSSVCLCLQSLLPELEQLTTEQSVETLILIQLHILNFPTHLDGFRQICTAVPMLLRDPRQPLSKQLYPAVAEALNISDQRSVEHSIRKCVRDAWAQRDEVVWARYFPPDANGQSTCPSNHRFLSRMTQLIQRTLLKE